MAQSLEELSSIYSEASELGLTALGMPRPQEHIIEDASSAVTTVPHLTDLEPADQVRPS